MKEEIYMCVGLSAKVVSLKDGMAIVDASGAKMGYYKGTDNSLVSVALMQ